MRQVPGALDVERLAAAARRLLPAVSRQAVSDLTPALLAGAGTASEDPRGDGGGVVTQAPVLTDALLARLKRTGNWMVRFSEDGIAYDGYRWPEIGAWAEAPDWNPDAVCGGGFHGQGPGGYGYCQGGSRFELCETKGHRVIVDGNKVKVRHARILAVDGEAWTAIMALCDTEFPGSLYCSGYGHPLPALQSVGGSLYCSGYAHPLPALQSVGRAAAQRRGPGREWRQMP